MKKLVTCLLTFILIFCVVLIKLNASESLISTDKNPLSYNQKNEFTLQGQIPAFTLLKINGETQKTTSIFDEDFELNGDGNYWELIKLELFDSTENLIESREIKIHKKIQVKLKENETKMEINGKFYSISTPPVFIENKIRIPIRDMVEVFGMDVCWIAETRTVIVESENIKVELQVIGGNYAIVNGEKIKLETPAIIIDGRVMMPIRFFQDVLDFEIGLDSNEQTFIIEKNSEQYIDSDDLMFDDSKFKNIRIEPTHDIKESCHIYAEIPDDSYVKLNGEKITGYSTFNFKGKLNPAPSFTDIKLELFDKDGKTIEEKPLKIENIKLIVYRLFVSKPEMDVDGETVELKTPVKIVDEIPIIPISTLKEIFGFESSWSNDNETLTIKHEDQTIELSVHDVTAKIDSETVILPHKPQFVDEELMISSDSVEPLFGVETKYLRGIKTIQIIKEIHPQ